MSLSLVCENVSVYRRRSDGTEKAILRQVEAKLNGGEGILVIRDATDPHEPGELGVVGLHGEGA